MLELGLILFFSIGGLWMYVTTPDQRQMVLGYVIALAVAMALLSLITGQGPNSHY
jgi:multisubunit Na+/H+ antiporter MnhE subunit